MSPVSFTPTAAAEEMLRRWIGLDPNTIGAAAIRRAVRLRMLAVEIDDLAAYLRRLESDVGERDRLVEEVVVAESWFFRDPQVYEQLRRFAVARLSGTSPDTSLRILSVPCAAGEEPYSIAMTLLDLGYGPDRFRIDAIDVSRVALSKARAGRYSPNAFRNADTAYRDRWFHSEKGVAVIDESVQRCVRFAWANVLDERLLDEALGVWRSSYDVVFCRNLLIYLTSDARQAVERAIGLLLKPDGMVVVGAAEPAILRDGWVPCAAGSTFTLRRATRSPGAVGRSFGAAPGPAVEAPKPPAGRPLPAAIGRGADPPGKGAPPEVATAAPAPAPAPAPPPEAPVVDVAEAAPGDTAAPPRTLREVIAAANTLANARRFSEAIALCEGYQQSGPPAAELFFLTGMLHQSLGRADLAEDCFHKTLYLDAAHEEALLALSLLATGRGDHRRAEQFRDSARRVLERKGAS